MWEPKITKEWHFIDMFGPEGYRFVHKNGLRLIISKAPFGLTSQKEWIHISVSRKDRLPDWRDLRKVKVDFLGTEGYAYTVYPPADKYVNIHETCLHIWALESGEPVLPEFSLVIGTDPKGKDIRSI